MLFRSKQTSDATSRSVGTNLATVVKSGGPGQFHTVDRLGRFLSCHASEIRNGRYRINLYRFLADSIPVISACVSTWAGLSAAPGKFSIADGDKASEKASDRLDRLSERMYETSPGNPGSVVTFLTDLFTCLYRDGIFGGFLAVNKDGSGVDRFIPIDSAAFKLSDSRGRRRLVLDLETGEVPLERDDFYYIPFSSDLSRPLGRSILQSIPFVAYIEQQLVDDMRRTSHNAGYHRLHVKVTPPDRMAGESDQAYVDRINGYFDSTVSMIKSCDIDDNPVTWDNVAIEHVGPDKVRTVTNSWFLNHRGMIEEICAGTNLAPFLLGYSYGATSTWSSFKFDLVMRQVSSIQTQVASFLEWIGNIDLALAGFDCRCKFQFNNSFSYQAMEKAQVQSSRIDSLLKLFGEGLIDKEAARDKAGELL